MTISLSDLKAKRAAMTQGEWVSRPEDAEEGEVYTDDEAYKIIVRISRAPVAANATGIVATHNAADVLIEIAEAALAYEQAKKDAAVVRYAFRNDSSDDASRRIEAHDNDEGRCFRAYQTALAKIKP